MIFYLVLFTDYIVLFFVFHFRTLIDGIAIDRVGFYVDFFSSFKCKDTTIADRKPLVTILELSQA